MVMTISRRERYAVCLQLHASGKSQYQIEKLLNMDRSIVQRQIMLSRMDESVQSAYFDDELTDADIVGINAGRTTLEKIRAGRAVSQHLRPVQTIRTEAEVRAALSTCKRPAVRAALEWFLMVRDSL